MGWPILNPGRGGNRSRFAARCLLPLGLALSVSAWSAIPLKPMVDWVGELLRPQARHLEPPALHPRIPEPLNPPAGTLGWPEPWPTLKPADAYLTGPLPWRDVAAQTGLELKVLLSDGSQRKPERARFLGHLSRHLRAPPRLLKAASDSKQFGQDFLAGAKLGETRIRALEGELAQLAVPWLKVPMEKRIFVVGAADSDAGARKLRAKLEKDGYAVFFYRFCEAVIDQLCGSRDVGAFFGSAGHAVALKTPTFADSQYISVELASIYHFDQGGVLMVFTPAELAQRLVASAGAVYTVAVFDLHPNADAPAKGTKRKARRPAP